MAARTRSRTSRMSGPLLATCRRAIRTGSWLGPKAGIEKIAWRDRRLLAGLCAAIALTFALPSDAPGRIRPKHPQLSHTRVKRAAPRPWPLEFPNSQYLAVKWADIEGWARDDLLAAFTAFRTSCKPIAAERRPPSIPKTLGTSLREPCRAARTVAIKDGNDARGFFERHFVALQISKL